MDTNYLIKLVNDFGGFIWYMFKYVTTELKPKLGEANGVLIGLIDRIRMMDNDLIRLKTKIETVKNQKHKLQKVVKLKTKE